MEIRKQYWCDITKLIAFMEGDITSSDGRKVPKNCITASKMADEFLAEFDKRFPSEQLNDGWQPFAAAPTSGNHILAYKHGSSTIIEIYWYSGQWYKFPTHAPCEHQKFDFFINFPSS